MGNGNLNYCALPILVNYPLTTYLLYTACRGWIDIRGLGIAHTTLHVFFRQDLHAVLGFHHLAPRNSPWPSTQ